MHFKDKDSLCRKTEEILCLIDNEANQYQLLRAYNLWYSRALEFVTVHARLRQKEFEERHAENQTMLCDLSRKDFQPLKMNLIIQMTIIEACEDRTHHLV